MKRLNILLSAAILLVISLGAHSQVEAKLRQSMIVTTEWLAKHLNDDSLVLLHVGDRKEYDAAHIPGAQFIQFSDISTPRGQGLTLELPPVEQLKSTFEKMGVSDRSRIVIYFGKDWVSPTTRVYFTLDYLGLGDRTSILDGGMPAWRAEGRSVTTEVKQPKAGSFTPRPNPKLVADAAWVNANSNKPGVVIIDARQPQFYTGAEAGQMPRAGRVPGARNIPFERVVDESNKFKNESALREIFSAAGVNARDRVATYCHIGQRASVLYFVARYLGYDARLYDGSFEDWSRRTDLPVEKSN